MSGMPLLLRGRIALFVSLSLVSLAVALMAVNWLREVRHEQRYGAAFARGQTAVWEEIIDVEVNRLKAIAARLAAIEEIVQAVRSDDRSSLADLMTRRLSEARADSAGAAAVEVTDPSGQLLYASAGLLEQPTLDAGLLARAVRLQESVSGPQHGARRHFVIGVARPLGSDPAAGAISVLSNLDSLLAGMQQALNVEAYLVNRRGILLQGSDRALWDAVHPTPLVRSAPVATVQAGDAWYTVATVPVRDSAGRTVGHLVTIADDTRSHAARVALQSAAIAAVAAFLLLLLGGLNVYLRRAFAPLDEAIGVLDALSRGDTSVAVRGGGKPDEIGRIAEAVNVFREHAIQVQRAERQREKYRRRQNQLAALRQELDIAHNMQQSILPTVFPREAAYQIHATMLPAREVGGDFYDFFQVRPGEVGLVVADVSGKGIPAALFMAVSRTVLKATAVTGLGPGDCLVAVNDLLAEENPAEMFVTLFYGILDTRTGRLAYANGGHNPPFVRRADGRVEALAGTDGLALGIVDQMPYDETAVDLAPGDTLLLYTDGVTEALDTGSAEYTAERLAAAVAAFPDGGVEDLVGHVLQDVAAFVGPAEQADDLTMLAVRYGGGDAGVNPPP